VAVKATELEHGTKKELVRAWNKKAMSLECASFDKNEHTTTPFLTLHRKLWEEMFKIVGECLTYFYVT
jgi:hypothetical protein